MSSPAEIIRMLVDWSDGDKAARDKVFPVVEEKVRRVAHSYMAKGNRVLSQIQLRIQYVEGCHN